MEQLEEEIKGQLGACLFVCVCQIVDYAVLECTQGLFQACSVWNSTRSI